MWLVWWKKKVPTHVVQVFVDMWLTHYGVPVIVVVDQAGTFTQECHEFDFDIPFAGRHAGWQQAVVERHGGLLSESWNNIGYESHVKLALAMRVQAKERNIDEARCHSRAGCVRARRSTVPSFYT